MYVHAHTGSETPAEHLLSMLQQTSDLGPMTLLRREDNKLCPDKQDQTWASINFSSTTQYGQELYEINHVLI